MKCKYCGEDYGYECRCSVEKIQQLERDNAALRAERDRLRAALEKCPHAINCYPNAKRCTCGRDAALSAPEKEDGK